MRNSTLSKERILNAAEKEFAQKGIYGARVDEIAKNAKINKRMIYEYFGNKEGLYTVVLKNAYNRLSEREEVALTDNIDCVKAIENIIKMYYEFLLEDESFVNLIMWENLNKAEYIKQSPDFVTVKNPLVKSLHRVIAEGKKQSVFKKELDEEQLAVLLITLSFSYFSNIHTLSYLMNVDLKDNEHIEKRVEIVTEMLLGYMKS